MENFKKEVGTKIIEQLPKGVSMETFWKAVKLNEMKQGGNPQEAYKTGSITKNLTEGLYTDKVIGETIKQIKQIKDVKDLSKFLEEVNKEYRGGEL